MVEGTIMVGIIAVDTIIIEDRDTEVVIITIVDIVTIMEIAIELQMEDMVTITAEAIIVDLRTTEVDVITVDTNKRGY